MDDRRNSMIHYLMSYVCYQDIKENISTTLDGLKQCGANEDLLIKFIDKSIGQLTGISWMQDDVNTRLKIRYSKSQLENFKRHIIDQHDVQS